MTGISGFPSDYLEQDPGIQPAEWDDLRKVLWTELKEIVIQNSALFGPIYPGDTHWRFTGYFLGQLLHLYPEDLNFVMSRILTEKTPTYYQTAQWHYEFLTTLTFNLKYDVEYERQPGETCEQP
jgi:hypothetical protein